jgi:molecular chaperone DnaK (HSP70)
LVSDLYGSPEVREAAKRVFKALTKFGGTVKDKEATALERAIEDFQEAMRRDLGLSGDDA